MKMKELERTYTIPLRREYMKVPKYKRAKKAITAIKQFLQKHMKAEEIKLGRELNLKIWERGIKNPPHHVKVNVKKTAEGVVQAELFGFEFKEKKMEKKKEPETLKEKLSEKIQGKADDKAKADSKEAKKEKSVKKEETKKEAKETPVKDKE
jgi:large subunit ribosomal protein L31e